ncbi:DUF952 domain-containing protein [Mycobacterium sp.]|jgi:uncharacterized protein (DUF952 family)|uniref:DUF952 domain-containing protein n=1 Tax=Mycobacterium sp. TaxID=1785 RepID=UPI002D24F1F4|nr:DUF952 domain-containing protein [Mycobacterium sp.]HZA10413.1 DUF952 domain-containing protein [Mycobacterium sp.]
MSHRVLLHICTAEDWAAARRLGEHRPHSLGDAGFVHLSTPQQVHLPANRLYRGRGDLLLLHVDPKLLDAPLRWEPGDATEQGSCVSPGRFVPALRMLFPGRFAPALRMLFPHLYGPLPVAAVIAVTEYPPGPDGAFAPFQPAV